MSQFGVSRQLTDRRPLNETEKALIRAAEHYPWNWQLRSALAGAIHSRGFVVDQFANCGELVDLLESVTKEAR